VLVTGVRFARRNRRIPSYTRLAALALLSMAMVFGGLADLASAQATIDVPTLYAEPATQVPFRIRVGPRDALPRGSFVRVRGLPPMAALSDGHTIAPGAWAIPISALPSLKITLPQAAVGRSEISVALVSMDGSVLAQAGSTVIVASPGGPLLTDEERERALRLVKKGHELLAQGGIAQARLLYERAADAGLALGAMAMAATYDPAELDRLGLLGLKPDRQTARRWYERALKLGATDAEQKLRRLGGIRVAPASSPATLTQTARKLPILI
jgi:hypothetical protein